MFAHYAYLDYQISLQRNADVDSIEYYYTEYEQSLINVWLIENEPIVYLKNLVAHFEENYNFWFNNGADELCREALEELILVRNVLYDMLGEIQTQAKHDNYWHDVKMEVFADLFDKPALNWIDEENLILTSRDVLKQWLSENDYSHPDYRAKLREYNRN